MPARSDPYCNRCGGCHPAGSRCGRDDVMPLCIYLAEGDCAASVDGYCIGGTIDGRCFG